MTRAPTKETAHGRWLGILTALGIHPDRLKNKHGPCPSCGGEDRFRYDDHKGNGDYYCNTCGAGNGFTLLMGVHGWDFSHAAAEVDRVLGSEDIPSSQPFQPEVNVAQRRANLNKLWGMGTAPSIALTWLARRGIAVSSLPSSLRGASGIHYAKGDHFHPAMLALVRNPAGEPVCIHRTYLGQETMGERKLMPPTEKLNGSSIHLGDVRGVRRIVVGEGIETVMTGMQALGLPGLACINAGLMEEVAIPANIEFVHILVDNDASFTGQAAGFSLAKRLKRKLSVEVLMPLHTGQDVNDVGTTHWVSKMHRWGDA